MNFGKLKFRKKIYLEDLLEKWMKMIKKKIIKMKKQKKMMMKKTKKKV